MEKSCTHCGAKNLEHARFCAKCGKPLHQHDSGAKAEEERTPAHHAAEMIKRTKTTTDELTAKTKTLWQNFAMGEKITAVGALVVIVSFILPWVSVMGQSVSGFGVGQFIGYAYFIPLSAIGSLALLYFSQGATKGKKILMSTWQILIGTMWAAISLLAIVSVNSIAGAMMGGYAAMAGGGSFGISIGFYLLAAGAIAIVVGAIKLQMELLRGI